MRQSTINTLWKQALERKDLVGGDIEHQEQPEGIFRGPIKSIKIVGDKLIVETEWTARAPIGGRHGLPMGGWRRHTGKNATTFTYELGQVEGMGSPITSAPRIVGNGHLHFLGLFGIAAVTIFPKGGSKLDKSKVAGL